MPFASRSARPSRVVPRSRASARPSAGLVGIVVLGVLAGCKTREFDTAPRTRAAAPAAAGATTAGLSDAAKRDLRLVEADPPGSRVTGEPPSDHDSDLHASEFERDGKDVRVGDNLDVRFYSKEWLPDQARVPPVPVPLATRSVLQTMRANRRMFSRVGPGGLPQEPTGIPGVDLSSAKQPNGKPLAAEDREMAALNVFNRYCVDLGANHVSDVVYHYYCRIAPIYSACHRFILAEHESLKNKGIEKPRREAIELCLKDPKEWSDHELAAYGKATPYAPLFKAFHSTQWVGEGAARANVFDYMLLSQTYAFDYDHQQAVLNVFYGEQKSPGAGPWDPSRKEDCRALRPPRRLDDKDANYCDPATPKARGMWGVGR